MNFTLWILKRIMKSLVGNGRWLWVEKYRSLIINEKPFSVLVTLLGGTLWFLISALIAVWITPRPPDYVLVSILLTPIIFYVYNWLMALHVIYTDEKMECWNELKR
jgi:ABC-type uncharacterized transport system permease subunit